VRFGERGVGRDRDGAAFLAVGEDLEEEFRAGLVQVEVAELVGRVSSGRAALRVGSEMTSAR